MAQLLELIYDYQRLCGTRDHLQIALDDADSTRLFGLERLLRGDGGAGGARRFPRLELPFVVQFTAPGGFGAGRVQNISGGGMEIACSRPLPVGARLLVRIADSRRDLEYAFPSRVVWASKRDSLMGLAFDGVPSRTEFCVPSAMWRRVPYFGTRPTAPLSA